MQSFAVCALLGAMVNAGLMIDRENGHFIKP